MGTFNAGFSARPFDLVLITTVTSQDHAALKSTVSWVQKIVQTGSQDSYDSTSAKSWTATIDGAAASGTFTYDFRNYNELILGSGSKEVTHTSDGTKTISLAASVPSGGVIGSASISTTETLPRLDVAPDAPTGVAVTRNSDGSQTITWTVVASTAKPVRSQKVYRRRKGAGVWSAVAAVADIPNGTTATFTDNTTEADGDYEYSVGAFNYAGSATSAAARIQATPATPTALAAAKSGADIVLTLTPATLIADCTHVIEHSTNGGSSWSAQATLAAGVTTYTATAPTSSLPHTYRAKAVTPTNALASGWATSATVQLLTAPSAATSLAPSGVACVAAEGTVLTWQHNPVDTTAQTKFQIRHRASGAGSWTEITAVASDESTWTLPAGTYASGVTVEWQVRTWGQFTNPSAYSATATLLMSTRPTAAISAPSSSLTTSTLTVAWTFFSAAGKTQAEWRSLLKQGSTVLETLAGSGTTASATFQAKVANGGSYTVTVEVCDSQGLWSAVATQAFTVSYLPPAAVTLTVTWDRETGRAYLETLPAVAVSGSTAAVATVDVQRRIDGGDWVTVVAGMPPTVYTFDPLPSIRGLNEYRAVGYSAIGATSTNATVSLPVDERQYCYLNWGIGLSEVARCCLDLDFKSTSGVEKALVQLAVGDYPTMLSGSAKTSQLSVSASLEWVTSSPIAVWEDAGQDASVHAWRDVSGRRMERASLRPLSTSQKGASNAQVDFELERIR